MKPGHKENALVSFAVRHSVTGALGECRILWHAASDTVCIETPQDWHETPDLWLRGEDLDELIDHLVALEEHRQAARPGGAR